MGFAQRFNVETEDNVVILPVENQVQVQESSVIPNLDTEEITAGLVDKIKKTPYWSDYSQNAQRGMIIKYFEAKIGKNNDYLYQMSGDEKMNFVNLILSKLK